MSTIFHRATWRWARSIARRAIPSTLDRHRSVSIAFAIGVMAFALAESSQAQMNRPSLFAGAGIQDNFSSASIEAYDGSTACGVFTSGSATRPGFFIGASMPEMIGPLGLRFSASFDNLSTSFATSPDLNRNTPLAFRLSDHSYVPISRERNYDATLSLVALHFLTRYEAISNGAVDAGFYGGIIGQHAFQESERIVTPSDAVFDETRLSHRSIGSGAIPVNRVQYGLELGIQYSLHFQRDLWIEPRIDYRFPFTSISNVSTTAWRVAPVSASIALAWHLPAEEPAHFTVHEWDSLIESTPKPQPVAVVPMLAASIAVLDTAGRPILDPKLEIERTHVLEVFPMLHYVFFDDGSSSIPSRYDLNGEFTGESELAGLDALEIHHRILDIVGKRLVENPAASITITGTRSEHASGDSAAGPSISLSRAKAVAQYLEDRWKLSAARVKVVGKTLPEAASDDHTLTGQAENERVELTSSDARITAPVVTERIERTATPPSFIFDPHIQTTVGIKSATLTVRQGHRILMKNDALTGATSDQYLWTLDERSMPDTRDSLIFELDVVDSSGHTAVATGAIHLSKNERDRYMHRSDTDLNRDVHRYSLILFDYSSSQLDRKKADVLMTTMAKAVADSSRIRLTGHTDRTGDEEFNDALARQRVERAAQILAKHLAEQGQAGHPIEIESHGSRDELFDNSLPEGRLLSRTVRAYIEKDLK